MSEREQNSWLQIQPLDTEKHNSSCNTQSSNYLQKSVSTVNFFRICGDFMKSINLWQALIGCNMWYTVLSCFISLGDEV